MTHPIRLAVTSVLALAAGSGLARSQFPEHRLQSISPLGGREGENVEVQLTGVDLEVANGLWFDHPGLRGFHVKGMIYRIAIAPGTPIGPHDVRAVGPLGISNPRTFVVGDRPESLEKEPNNLPSEANPLGFNTVVNGRMDAAPDVDCFSFDGKAGQRVFLDLSAYRLDTRLDGTLRVLGPAGREIAASEVVVDADPFLDITLPEAGRYVVKVQDVVYNGSPEYGYRLTLHDRPHLDAIIPAIAAPGVAATFSLLGRNLGGNPVPGLSIDGRLLEQKQVTFTPPLAGDPDPAQPDHPFLLSPGAPRIGFEYRFAGASGLSNPLFVGQSSDPIVLEAEPNDDAHAQKVAVPCDISGAFAALDDLDVYRFAARKGEIWWIEASAERLGSRADPVFVVQKVMEKATPQDLATGEDLPESIPGSVFPTGSVDAILRWQVPEDGTYQVALSDQYGSQRGDPRLFYRLSIRPARPDFRLFVTPLVPANLIGDLTIRAGGRGLAYAVAMRIDGFNAPIRVEAHDLPTGVSCEPVLIGQGQYQAPLVFTAAADAKAVEAAITVVGRSLAADRKEILDYNPGTSKTGPEPTHRAIAGALVWPPAPNPMGGPTTSQVRVTRGLTLAVRPGAAFLLSAKAESWAVAPGGQLELTIEVERRPGFVEAVGLTATDLPPNMAAAGATIPKEAKSAVLKLAVPANVPPGNYSFLVRGTGPFPFNKDPNAKEKPNINVTEPSNPVSLTVRRP